MGASILIYLCSTKPALKKANLRPIYWEAVSDLGLCIWNLLCYLPPTLNYQPLDKYSSLACTLTAMWGQFCFIASFSWYGILCLTTNYVLKGGNVRRLASYRVTISQHTFVWSMSFVLSSLPLAADAYGPLVDSGPESHGVLCWLPGNDNYYRLVHYVPCAICIFMAGYLLIFVICLRKNIDAKTATQSSQAKQNAVETTRTIIKFLLVFMLFWLGPLVVRLLELGHFDPPGWWTYQFTIRRGSPGFVQFLIWCTSPLFRSYLTCNPPPPPETIAPQRRPHRKKRENDGGLVEPLLGEDAQNSSSPQKTASPTETVHHTHDVSSLGHETQEEIDQNPQRLASYYREQAQSSSTTTSYSTKRNAGGKPSRSSASAAHTVSQDQSFSHSKEIDHVPVELNNEAL